MSEKEIPKDWKRVRVDSIAKLYRGINYTKDLVSDTPFINYLPVLRGNNINVDLNYDDLVYVPKELIKSEQLIQKEDIIFAMSSGSKHLVGKSAVAKADFNGSYGAFCALLRVDKGVNKKYISLVFRGNGFRKLISEIAKGTNINNLKREHILGFELLLPPLEAQQAIVTKIEELFAELDKGIEYLKTAQSQLKVYKQSVLKWAFEGKLTSLNPDSFDLSDEHDLAMVAEPQEVYGSVKHQGNPKNHGTFEEGLPERWKLVKLGELFLESPQNGLYKSSTEYGTGTPIVRIDGFYEGKILRDYLFKRVRLSPEEIMRYEITVGDILINRVNSMPYLGKCGLVKYLSEKTVFESNIMKIKIKNEYILPEFLTLYLTSKKGISELRKNAKQAVNQASINQTDVSNVLIPLPQIKEQAQTVEEIESRLSVADKMEETLQQSLLQAESLRQSILKKAFEGELVK